MLSPERCDKLLIGQRHCDDILHTKQVMFLNSIRGGFVPYQDVSNQGGEFRRRYHPRLCDPLAMIDHALMAWLEVWPSSPH